MENSERVSKKRMKKQSRDESRQSNIKQLVEFFGACLDEKTIEDVFQSNRGDMAVTIDQLSKLTGIQPFEENEEESSDLPTKFTLKEVNGDLFSCGEEDSIAHCVSRDLHMGKGIAVLFKKKFGGIEELSAQDKGIGEVAILKRGKRFIYYLITKENYWHKPTYDSLRKTLEELKKHIIANQVKRLSIPKLGCGLDRLLWPKVKQMLKEIFQETDLQITTYFL